MVVYQNYFSLALDKKFSLTFRKKLSDNHYKIICRPAKSAGWYLKIQNTHRKMELIGKLNTKKITNVHNK